MWKPDGVDRITNLHESVVCHILSRLPFKVLVRTSVLSKAWKHKWTSSDSIDIKNIPLCNRTMETFIQSMNMLMSCKNLKIFRYESLNLEETSWFEKSIPAILRHNLECLEVVIAKQGIVYPSSLLNSTTSLSELSLERGELRVVTKNIALNLTGLYLRRIHVVNENPNSSTLAFSFPVLKEFLFTCGKWLNVKVVEIDAPMLVTFEYQPFFDGDFDYNNTIAIVAPRLTKIVCWAFSFLPKNVTLNGSSVDSTFTRSRDYWLWKKK